MRHAALMQMQVGVC